MSAEWRVEQRGRSTVTKADFELLWDAGDAAAEFIAAATTDPQERERLLNAVMLADDGEPVALPNGKTLEIIELERF